MSEKMSIYDIEKGEKFIVKSDNCKINVTKFIGQGAAGCYQESKRVKLKPGDIIKFDHVAYLGSDPGPGVPWFKIDEVGRGAFWPNDWGNISKKDIEPYNNS